MRLFSKKPATPAVAILAALLFFGCSPQDEEPAPPAPSEEETVVIHDIAITNGQTIFVPAYSEVPVKI